ncbi:hypothetical protein I6H96_11440 [Brucella anthropi]|uniref:Uncharacterized protein n=1 Tax=Brucella anthropi (strain ATCC 49188 / DSM 6882 / CCUG 24695 / JCM 21032 / LMG 3331 / NBRC 15819 / NCTC 12168 / Alc 37) TaxID=439375 RepID=A6WVF1_BRUA4|nr:hypothetical protein [Brucella anthropi]ABS12955.1 hypothetical protein Oant_0224 [Brucella anthropi ATCC 49188]NKC47591.1 hypothetical protein [Brucella anthropi ATCC 49188]NKC48972.1 hypothetical protein [Brucella anthropi ATCC 49188]QQC24792.1 hypothetical protein I6H96_11440 [Brucella anthropi]SUA60221.1 Uncharacterised protein [Brucella anthropi]
MNAGHNVDQEKLDEQRFLNGFREIKELKSDIGGTMGTINGVYKTLKAAGFTKADVKWAFELEEKDSGEVIETMKRRLRIAAMLGHGLARQIDLFDEDRTPLSERAYLEGMAAGRLRKEMTNPHDLSTEAGQEWQRGFNDGTSLANIDLSSALDEAHGDTDFPDEEAA